MNESGHRFEVDPSGVTRENTNHKPDMPKGAPKRKILTMGIERKFEVNPEGEATIVHTDKETPRKEELGHLDEMGKFIRLGKNESK